MVDTGLDENGLVRPKKETLRTYPLSELSTLCLKERERYHLKISTESSPACTELFRRAFGGEQDAWSVVFVLFRPLVRSWLGSRLMSEETDDLMQDAFLSFSRYAPANLHVGDNLGPVLSYLRACTRTSLLMYLRKQRLTKAEMNIERVGDIPSEVDIIDQVEFVVMLRKRLKELVMTYDEEIVLRCYFIEGMKPQEILAKHSHAIQDIEHVYSVIQRLSRRIRRDDTIRELVPHLAR